VRAEAVESCSRVETSNDSSNGGRKAPVPNYENIPAELREPALWLQYYPSLNPKHPDKKPRKHPEVKYGTPEERDANLRSLDYLIANRTLKTGGGYQRWTDPDEGLTYIDLDHVRNAETGEIEERAQAIINALDSYTEVSESGTGLHIVCRAQLSVDYKPDGTWVEIWGSGQIPNRLLAMTGDLFGGQDTIEDRQQQAEELLRRAQSGEFGPTVTAPCVETAPVTAPPETSWPDPMEPAAFHGIAGECVRLIEPETEADPVALLTNFLIAAGVLFGREAWTVADGRRHYPIEYLMMAGSTGTGRKGTATARITPVFEAVDDKFRGRILSGLSSGEGLIKGISPKDDEDPGITRRFLILLPEFASLLGVMKREGNTMSAIMREAWDGGRLRVLTRKDPLDVDNVNLSMIAHITPSELLSGLTETEKVNGFANRFLITCVRRSKLLPEGGGDPCVNGIVMRLHEAVDAARCRGLLQRDAEARELWNAEYQKLTAERTGMKGALCSRADAHVLRLSLLYALLDGAAAIKPVHLRAALAVWDYSERSVQYLFGGITGDPVADKILAALAHGPCSLSELHRVFHNHQTSEWLLAKLADMTRARLVRPTTKAGDRKEAVQAWERVQ
jgi:hypothetical protein